jgi:hypothetical protein
MRSLTIFAAVCMGMALRIVAIAWVFLMGVEL